MRYAIVSDIHANLQAWNAVLLDIRSSGVERIVCLGDIVGYGPNPVEVMQSVYANVNNFVLGNHDAAICGKMDENLFNDGARDIIRWSRANLGRNAVRFLASLPLTLDGGDFRCAHSEFANPGSFAYVIDPEDAVHSWDAVDTQLLFIGHTHVPGIFLTGESGTPHLVEPQDFELERGKRYLVNVGSVGQPRDGETRASYCVFNDHTRSVYWRRIPFDIDAYKTALESRGLSSVPSYFLHFDPRRATPPLRKMLGFSPPESPDEALRDTVQVQDIGVLQKRVLRWKSLAAGAAALGLAGLIVLGGLFWRHAHRRAEIRPESMTAVTASAHPVRENILSLPTAPTQAGSPIPDWQIELGDKRRQGVWVVPGEDNDLLFLFHSEKSIPMSLTSHPVLVTEGMKLCLEADMLKSDDFNGNINAVLSLMIGPGDYYDQFLVKEFVWRKSTKSDWVTAKATTRHPLPNGARIVRLSLRGDFAGRAHIRGVKLYVTER